MDALSRLPLSPSLDDKGSAFDQRLLDAQKAIDEAKYVASANMDKLVLKKLQASEMLDEAMVTLDMLDRRWKQLQTAHWQCVVELNYAFEPDKLTVEGRATAREGTCMAKEQEALKGMTDSQ